MRKEEIESTLVRAYEDSSRKYLRALFLWGLTLTLSITALIAWALFTPSPPSMSTAIEGLVILSLSMYFTARAWRIKDRDYRKWREVMRAIQEYKFIRPFLPDALAEEEKESLRVLIEEAQLELIREEDKREGIP